MWSLDHHGQLLKSSSPNVTKTASGSYRDFSHCKGNPPRFCDICSCTPGWWSISKGWISPNCCLGWKVASSMQTLQFVRLFDAVSNPPILVEGSLSLLIYKTLYEVKGYHQLDDSPHNIMLDAWKVRTLKNSFDMVWRNTLSHQTWSKSFQTPIISIHAKNRSAIFGGGTAKIFVVVDFSCPPSWLVKRY